MSTNYAWRTNINGNASGNGSHPGTTNWQLATGNCDSATLTVTLANGSWHRLHLANKATMQQQQHQHQQQKQQQQWVVEKKIKCRFKFKRKYKT